MILAAILDVLTLKAKKLQKYKKGSNKTVKIK